MKTKKYFGQHFLIDQKIIQHIINELNISENSNILEIGPGAGALTYPILKTNINKLVSVEIDDDLIQTYFEVQKNNHHFQIVHKDILDLDIETIINTEDWIIVGNLPYNITTPILKRLIEWKDLYNKAVIMIQEEVAQKLIKKKGKDYTTLSLLVQFHFDIVLHDKVLPDSFEPSPKVNSRVLSLIPKNTIKVKNEQDFWKWVQIFFVQPRRTIANNIKGTIYQDKLPENIKGKRAQELELNDFIKIWENI